MASDDAISTTETIPKHLTSRKDRILSYNQSRSSSLVGDWPIKRKLTAPNRPSSRLPKLLEKASIYPSTPDVLQSRRPHLEEIDTHTSVPSKLEQPSSNTRPSIRLPTFYTLTSDDDHKRMIEFRRRQIYALNHLMRRLEQEQFGQFCKSHGIGTD